MSSNSSTSKRRNSTQHYLNNATRCDAHLVRVMNKIADGVGDMATAFATEIEMSCSCSWAFMPCHAMPCQRKAGGDRLRKTSQAGIHSHGHLPRRHSTPLHSTLHPPSASATTILFSVVKWRRHLLCPGVSSLRGEMMIVLWTSNTKRAVLGVFGSLLFLKFIAALLLDTVAK